MAHNSVESMRDRAFLKGRTAFRSDAEYNAALRGEIDDLDEAMEEQRKDREYELALKILGSASKGELEDVEWFAAASVSDTMTPDSPYYVEDEEGEETFQLSELPGGRVRLERFEDGEAVEIEATALAGAAEELSEKEAAKPTEERGEIERFATPTEAGEAFRDVLNSITGLDKGKLDDIVDAVRAFNDGDRTLPFEYPDHFTMTVHAAGELAIADRHGTFVLGARDALGVLSETAEAMSAADGPTEGNPVLAALVDEVEDAEMDELPDFLANDRYADIDLNCGKSLRWRDGILPKRKLIVIDDPDQQNWSMVSREELADALAKACNQRRLEKLEEMLGRLPDALLDKIIGTARQVVANGYSVGIRLEIEDEDGRWVAYIKVLPKGKVRFETDDGTVEVSGRELLETAEAARGL